MNARQNNDRRTAEAIDGGLSRDDVNNNSGALAERKYFRSIPETLSRQICEYELVERRAPKKNIFVRGVRTVGTGIQEEIGQIIKDKMGLAICIEKMRAIGGGLVIKLESRENKIKIMKSKKLLKGIDIWLDDDYTEGEKKFRNG